MPTAYVSATSVDLTTHRRIASEVLRRFGYVDVAMEYYVAENKRPIDKCLEDVAACDLYVGIFAWRYGDQPPKEKLSFTELEYRHAVKLKKPRLLFVVDDNAQWNVALMDIDRRKIAALHKAVRKDRLSGTFSTADSLEARLSQALETRTKTTVAKSTTFDLTGYYAFVRSRYGLLDLDALNDPKRDQNLRMSLQSVFVEQDVKEDPPPLELPKELLQMLMARSDIRQEDLPDGLKPEDISSYASKPLRPSLDALGAPENRCAVVLGDPGAGKSTLLRYILIGLGEAEPSPRLAPLAGRVPVLVDLRAYAAMRGEHGIATFIEYFDRLAKETDNPLTGAALEHCLEHGAVVMFDGVDEIFDTAEQEKITQQIASFAEKHASARLIVTSRIIGYPKVLRTAGFRHFTLQELREEQVIAFVSQWYALTVANPDEVPSRVARIRGSFAASPSVRQLAGNPMLLTIMAIIGKHQDLPRERWKLYDHAASVLVQHWDVKKHLTTSRPGEEWMVEDDKKELLCRLAFAMQRGKAGLAGNYIHARELQEEFESYLKERGLTPLEALTTARDMISQFHKRNFILCLFGSSLYGFVHRAFLEFFCAKAIVERFRTTRELPIEKLKSEVFGAHRTEKAWHEVLRLICGMIGDEYATELIEYLTTLDPDANPPRNLILAIGCLSELRRIELATDVATRLLEWSFSCLMSYVDVDFATRNELALNAAAIGPRWPNREHLISLFGSAQKSHLQSSFYSFVASIGSGSEVIRQSLVQRLLTKGDPFAGAAAHILGFGWRTSETAAAFVRAMRIHARSNDRSDVINASGVLASDPAVAAELVRIASSKAHGSFMAQMVVMDEISDYDLLFPILRTAVMRYVRSGSDPLISQATLKLERIIDHPEARLLLQCLTAAEKENVRKKANEILARHPLQPNDATLPIKKKRPAKKRQRSRAGTSASTRKTT